MLLKWNIRPVDCRSVVVSDEGRVRDYNNCINVGKRDGEWGRQAGSINEESQVRDGHNITFIYNQPGNRRLSPESDTWVPRQQLRKRPASAGTLGKGGRGGPSVGWVLLYVHRNRMLFRDGSPGRPPRLSHSSWALMGPSAQVWTLRMIGPSNVRPVKKEEEGRKERLKGPGPEHTQCSQLHLFLSPSHLRADPALCTSQRAPSAPGSVPGTPSPCQRLLPWLPDQRDRHWRHRESSLPVLV